MIRNGIASMVGLIATIVRVVCSVIGALIVIHAVFVLFSANPQNVLVEFTAGIRDTFGWFTKNLFTPKDAKIGQAINDALAGLIWVIVGNLASRLILRFAPAKKSSDKKSAKNETPRATPVRQSAPSQKPAEEPKAEQPKADAPQAEQPAAAEKKPQENQPESEQEQGAVPKVPSPAAAAVLQPESEPESGAKHEARATARREESAQEEPAEDESAEEEPAADKAQA